MRKEYILMTLMLFLSIGMMAQGQPTWELLTNGDHVTSIAEDGNILWIGTKGGLVKYDKGSEEKTFYNTVNSGLPSNAVEAIALDDKGNPWIGTYDAGIALFKDDKWKVYNTENSGLAHDQIYDLHIDQSGTKWIGTQFTLLEMKGETFTPHPTEAYAHVQTITVRGPDDIYAGWGHGSFSEIWHFNGTKLAKDSSFNQPGLYRLYTDQSNSVWACYEGGVAQLTGNGWQVMDHTNSGLPDAKINAMGESANGHLYFGTEAGLFKFDGANWSAIDLSNSNIHSDQLNFITFGADGSLYAGSLDNGLAILKDGEWTTVEISNSPLTSNYLPGLTKDDDGMAYLLVPGMEQILTVKENNWGTIPLPENFPSYHFTLSIEPSGKIWLATNAKSVFEQKGNQWKEHDLSSLTSEKFYLRNIQVDSKGGVWAGSLYGGVFYYDGNQWQEFNKANSPLNSDMVKDFALDAGGNIWIALSPVYENGYYEGGGVARFDGSSFEMFTQKNSALTNNHIDHLIAIEEVVYAGGSSLNVYENGSWTVYDKDNSGLSLHGITRMTAGANGSLWLYGIVPGTVGYEFVNFDGETFTSIENVPISNYSPYSTYMLALGNELWITAPSLEGLLVMKQATPQGAENPETAQRTLSVYPVPATDVLHITASSGGADEMQYTVYDLQGRALLAGELKLTEGTAQDQVNISGLPAGTYNIQVKSMDMEESMLFIKK